MRRPRIIHPSRVTVAQMDRTPASWDPVLKHHIGEKEFDEGTVVKGQIQFSKQQRRDPRPTGEFYESAGYVICENWELRRKSVTPENGDKIIAVDGRTQDFEIVEVQDGTVYDKPYWTFLYFERVMDTPER